MEGGVRGAEPSWCRCSWATPVGHSACDLRLPRPRHHARADCYRAVARCPLAGVFRGSASAARDTCIAVPVRPRPRLPHAPFRSRLRVALRLRCGRFGVVLRASAVLRACRGEEPGPRDCLARRAFSFVEQWLEVVVSAWALGVRAARVRAGRFAQPPPSDRLLVRFELLALGELAHVPAHRLLEQRAAARDPPVLDEVGVGCDVAGGGGLAGVVAQRGRGVRPGVREAPPSRTPRSPLGRSPDRSSPRASAPTARARAAPRKRRAQRSWRAPPRVSRRATALPPRRRHSARRHASRRRHPAHGRSARGTSLARSRLLPRPADSSRRRQRRPSQRMPRSLPLPAPRPRVPQACGLACVAWIDLSPRGLRSCALRVGCGERTCGARHLVTIAWTRLSASANVSSNPSGPCSSPSLNPRQASCHCATARPGVFERRERLVPVRHRPGAQLSRTTSPHCHVHRRLEPFGMRSTPSPWRMPAAHSPS